MAQKPVPLDENHSVRAWWGKELRNWRRARRLSSRALGELVQLSGTLIERIEKNQRRCTAQLAAKFDVALDAGGALTRLWRYVEREEQQSDSHADNDADLPAEGGMDDSHSGKVGEIPVSYLKRMSAVERRKLMLLLGGLGAAATAVTSGPARPRAVRAEDVQQVRAASIALSQWDARFGGDGLVQGAAEGELARARALLRLDCPISLSRNRRPDQGELGAGPLASAGALASTSARPGQLLRLLGARYAGTLDLDPGTELGEPEVWDVQGGTAAARSPPADLTVLDPLPGRAGPAAPPT
ncbi:helix-turn-helix domain-containing protein [Streptomyces sp. R301]|uniref:helix-turn-helix domain-containing protein n=1 Tax=unclassified Streptomyces TaxID=2593676 RepID=UPI003211F13B